MNFNTLIVSKLKLYPFATISFVVGLAALITWQARNTQPAEYSIFSADVTKDHGILNDNELNGKDLARDLEKATRIEKRVKGGLLDPTNLIGARTTIDQLAESHGITLVGQPITEITKPGRKDRPNITVFQPIQYKITFSGTPVNVASFLKNLENNSAMFCRIDEAAFSHDKTVETKISASITFEILGIKK